MEHSKQTDQETITPGGKAAEENELSDKELDRASGGLNPQPLPPDKLPPYLKI